MIPAALLVLALFALAKASECAAVALVDEALTWALGFVTALGWAALIGRIA